MPKSIEEALLELDPENLNHWTTEGLPRIETVKLLVSDHSITREMINSVAPNFTRESFAEQLKQETKQAEASGIPKPANVVTGDEQDVESLDLKSQLNSVQEKIKSIQEQISDLRSELSELIQQESYLDGAINQKEPKKMMNPEIHEYLEAQTKHEQDRNKQLESLRKAGALELVETLKSLGAA